MSIFSHIYAVRNWQNSRPNLLTLSIVISLSEVDTDRSGIWSSISKPINCQHAYTNLKARTEEINPGTLLDSMYCFTFGTK